MEQQVEAPPTEDVVEERPSLLRAWGYLVWHSWVRQMPIPGLRGVTRPAYVRQTVWIALILLVFSAIFIAINTTLDRWNMSHWKFPRRGPNYAEWAVKTRIALSLYPAPMQNARPDLAMIAASQAILDNSEFIVFAYGMVMGLFFGFLLPVWSLSFGTEALGSERESNTLIWLTTRPMPRWAIYLAKFVALLPWCLLLNIGGFVLLCALGGEPGHLALRLFWPAVVWATFAFAALFLLMGALFRRPAVVAAVYVFFLEMIFGSMPGYLKRVSIAFYARCMIFEAGASEGIAPSKPHIFLGVSGATAQFVLIGVTLGLLALGMVLFTRMEYHNEV